MITKDGGYIAAGNGVSCECENGKSVGFVFRADVCQGKVSLKFCQNLPTVFFKMPVNMKIHLVLRYKERGLTAKD